MEKLNQSLLLEIAEQNKEIIYEENKTLAKLDWLISWEKNPKLSVEKDLTRLKKQIEELGVYKPLIIYLEKNNGVILGGNQRYKVLKELKQKDKTGKYDYVWVSIVNSNCDYDKIKYALSDNEQIGKYDREKLKEILLPQIEQGNLFNNFSIDFNDNQTIDKIINDLNLTEQEYKFKGIKKELKEMGINEETIDVLGTMTEFNKHCEELEDVDLCGKITGQKFPFMFWIEDEEIYEQLKKIYDTGHKDKYDIQKFVSITEQILNIKLPTDKDKLKELMDKILELDKKIKEFEELQGEQSTIKKLLNDKEELDLEIQRKYNLIYKN